MALTPLGNLSPDHARDALFEVCGKFDRNEGIVALVVLHLGGGKHAEQHPIALGKTELLALEEDTARVVAAQPHNRMLAEEEAKVAGGRRCYGTPEELPPLGPETVCSHQREVLRDAWRRFSRCRRATPAGGTQDCKNKQSDQNKTQQERPRG